MARMRTLAQLREEVRQRADMVNSAFVTNAEVDRCINESWAHMYDQLLATGEDYYLKYVDIPSATSGGIFQFATRTASSGGLATDVYQVRGVDAIYSDNCTVNLPRFNWEERNIYSATPALTPYYPIIAYRVIQDPVSQNDAIEIIPNNSNGITNLRVWYYPNPKYLTVDADSIDGRSGWEEWVVIDAATKLLAKEESDTSQLERQAARIWARVMVVAQNRDAGQSKRVTDVSYNSGMWPWSAGFPRR